jgi:hypothetical protein
MGKFYLTTSCKASQKDCALRTTLSSCKYLQWLIQREGSRENIWTEEGWSNRTWRKLHNEERHIFYSFSNIITHIKSRRMRWAGHVARMGEEKKWTRFWWESLEERDHSEDRGVDGGMESEYILGKLAGECKVDSVGSGYGPVAGSCDTAINLRVLAPGR